MYVSIYHGAAPGLFESSKAWICWHCPSCMLTSACHGGAVGDDMAEIAVSMWGLGAHSLWAAPNVWRSLVFWGVIAPLTALPNLSMLKYSSSAGLLGVLVYCCMSLLFATAPGKFPACGAGEAGTDTCRGEVVPVHSQVLTSLSLYFFIYSMQMKLFLVCPACLGLPTALLCPHSLQHVFFTTKTISHQVIVSYRALHLESENIDMAISIIGRRITDQSTCKPVKFV